MKTSIKILLLVIALFLAVGGVLYFVRTAVSPPQHLEYDNQYVTHLDSVIASTDNMSLKELDNCIDPILDFSDRMRSEAVVNPAETDEPVSRVLTYYARIFNSEALSHFKKSYWDRDLINGYARRIDRVSGYFLSDGNTLAVSDPDIISDFSRINNIIAAYNSALALVADRGYHGVNAARNAINRANEYMEDSDLQPNTSLMNALGNVRENIANAHASYLISRVNSLDVPMRYPDWSTYTSSSSAVSSLVDEYESNGSALYGSAYRSNLPYQLRNSISYYNTNADAHFNGNNSYDDYDNGYN